MPSVQNRKPGAGTPDPERKLSRVHGSMITGLPEPGTPEANTWLREALAALEGAAPVDLGPLLQRIADLEARPLAPPAQPPVDLSAILRRLAALEGRVIPEPVDLSAILARLDALEARPAAGESGVTVLDPLDPRSWHDVASARAALMVLVTQEAALRCGHTVALYEEMVELDAKPDRTADEDLRLLQHGEWAKERQSVELARLTHNGKIRGLESVDDALAYDWKAGWPEIENVAPPAPNGV